MNANNIICFEYKKEDNVYRLQMPMGAPLGEAYEAVNNFQAELVRLINEHQDKQKKEADEPKEAEKEEEQAQERRGPDGGRRGVRRSLTLLLFFFGTAVFADGEVRVHVFTEPAGEVYLGQRTDLIIEVQTDSWFTTAPKYPELVSW